MPREMTPEEAQEAILAGKASPNTIVRGSLYFGWGKAPSRLPEGLQVEDLMISRAPNLKHLPERLRCRSLTIFDGKITEIPSTIRVRESLMLSNCPRLEKLPRGLNVQKLWLSNCPRLSQFPEKTEIQMLRIERCNGFVTLPAGLRVQQLLLQECTHLTSLPPDLNVSDLCIIQQCRGLEKLPARMHLRVLALNDLPKLSQLPADLVVSEYLDLSGLPCIQQLWPGLRLHTLKLRNCERLTALPEDLQIGCHLDVSGCLNLEHLPSGVHKLHMLRAQGCLALQEWAGIPALDVTTLDLSGCANLRTLPEQLRVRTLSIAGCISLTHWPASRLSSLRRLNMRGCRNLPSLPPGTIEFDQLDLGDCPQITELPADLHVTGWLDLANTRMRTLPPSAAGFKLRWHGVSVPGRPVLYPETIGVREILEEANIERRRAMIERIGLSVFLEKAHPDILDSDEDPGGPRRLLRVDLNSDEPLVCLQVRDPSTGRAYILRVPPTMRSCHQAAAWVAGFDDPGNYHPLVET